MKREKKFMVAGIVISILILLLPGFLFASGAQENVPASVPVSVDEPEFTKPVEITFWYALSGSNGQAVLDLVEKFNAQDPYITVAAEFAGGYAPALNKLKLAIQSGEAPNIGMVYDIGTRTMIDSEAVVALEDLISQFPSVGFKLDNFVKPALNYYTFYNKVYALPFAQSSPILYYNKDRFREAGLDPEKPPVTYEEFRIAAQKLTDPSADGRKVGASWAIRSWLVETEIALQGGLMTNNGNGRESRATEVFLNQDPAVNFVTMWAELAEAGYYLNPGRDWTEGRNNFASGISAMMLQSTAGIARTIADVGDNFEMGTGLLPRPANAEGGVIISGNALWAIDGHPAIENKATLKFMNWLAQPAQQEAWHMATGYYPLSIQSIENLTNSGYYDENPHFYTAIRQLLESPSTPATAGGVIGPYPEIRDMVETSIENILANKLDVKKTYAQLTLDINQILAKYNRIFGE